LYEMV
jgi:hypothetical protein